MNGPEHYAAAERLMNSLNGMGTHQYAEVAPSTLAAAQVHATLALAAATAWGPTVGHNFENDDEAAAWVTALKPAAAVAQ